MSNIRVDVNYTIQDGSEIVFRSPVDCSQITGLRVYYPLDGNITSKDFALADAHANNVGNIDFLFAENVVVKVILDVTASMAYVQNADTNAYLEGKFKELSEKSDVFRAESGVTDVQDIYTAWNHGKLCVMYAGHGGSGTKALVCVSAFRDAAYFTCVDEVGTTHIVKYNSDKTITHTTKVLRKTITESRTDDDIPTAKAVYDFVTAQLEAMPNAAEVGY